MRQNLEANLFGQRSCTYLESGHRIFGRVRLGCNKFHRHKKWGYRGYGYKSGHQRKIINIGTLQMINVAKEITVKLLNV